MTRNSSKQAIHGRTCVWGTALILAFAVSPGFAASGAKMVRDIKTVSSPYYSFTVPLAALGNDILFSSFDDSHPSGLWKSDGTQMGTAFIADPCPQFGNPYGYYLSALGTRIIFSANCPSTGIEPWVTDGTLEGTMLLRDISPGPAGNNTLWKSGVVLGQLYFAADDGTHGEEMWKTDGTVDGTIMVRDINPGGASVSLYGGMATLGNAGIFSADDGVHGWELWRTDGTETGTYLLKDIRSGPASSSPGAKRDYSLLGNRLYFIANDGVHGYVIWKTDGTPEGTVMAVDHDQQIWGLFSWKGSLYFSDVSGLWKSNGTQAGTQMLKWGARYASSFLGAQNSFYFIVEDGTHGDELWRSDGTSSGTYRVKDILPGNDNNWFWNWTLAGDLIYFSVYDDLMSQELLWRSDGTEQGTFQLLATSPALYWNYFTGFVAKNGILYFGAQGLGDFGSLWRSDGTIQGTYPAAKINPAISSFPYMIWYQYQYWGPPQSNVVLFQAEDGTHGQELWRSDGTEAGTGLLVDLWPGSEGSASYLLPTSKGTFLSAWDFAYGYPIDGFWRTDGTPEGTLHLPGFQLWEVREVGGQLIACIDEGIHGFELWKTDGTSGGTQLIADVFPGPESSNPSFWETINGNLLLGSDDGAHGWELWRTDGTPEGTGILKDINPGAGKSDCTPMAGAFLDGSVVFMADDGTHGRELWKTDGTESGTVMVKDIHAGSGSTDIRGFIAHENLAYFLVSNGQDGEELWVSDGSGNGTRMIKQMAPVDPYVYQGLEFVPLNGIVLFWGNDGLHGTEPWITDGTEAGTRLLKDICAGPGASAPIKLFTAPEGLYFSAFDFDAGYELWRTDGTEAGTARVVDLWPGPESSMPSEMIRLDNGRLIFSAATPADGIEVWETDGTAMHTLKAADIVPGPGSSHPQYFVRAGPSVFFRATDGVHGFELWSLPADSSGAVPDGMSVPGEPLHVAKSGGDALALSWGASCYYRDQDFAVYSGTLASWGDTIPETCSTGAVASWKAPISGGDTFYLVVPRSAGAEGSYGRDSQGNERAPSPKACAPQAVHPCP